MKGNRSLKRLLPMDHKEPIRHIPPRQTGKYCQIFLVAAWFAFMILITTSLFIIKLDLDCMKKLQIKSVPMSEKGESLNSSQQCPVLTCPPPIAPECPKLKPEEYLELAMDEHIKSVGQKYLPPTPPPSPSRPLRKPGPLTYREKTIKLPDFDYYVQLYSDSYFGVTARLFNVKREGCLDLPAEFDDVTSSIKTPGVCVILCADPGCRGRCVEMTDSTPAANWLGSIGFNDQVSSLKTCD